MGDDAKWKLVQSPWRCAVVGVSFTDFYPGNLQLLAELAAQGGITAGEPLPVVLVRNPDNRYDSNAVEVHVPAVDTGEPGSGMIGHLPAPVARTVAPYMDAGGRFKAALERVRIHPDHPDRPGLDVVCQAMERIE